MTLRCVSAGRLRDRPPSELAAHLQHLGAGQPVQVGRLHGHAARQVVQGGSLWQAQLRRHRGRSTKSEETPKRMTYPLVASCSIAHKPLPLTEGKEK